MSNSTIFQISVLIMYLSVTCSSCNSNIHREHLAMNNNNEKNMKTGYPWPWTEEITEIAVQAILTSIDNINNPELPHDSNFPTDINNMPFYQTEKTEFDIVGYKYPSKEKLTGIYTIDFQPKNREYKSGPRITVEVNIKEKKAIRVYMTPDA